MDLKAMRYALLEGSQSLRMSYHRAITFKNPNYPADKRMIEYFEYIYGGQETKPYDSIKVFLKCTK
jgi:hypothetical protein